MNKYINKQKNNKEIECLNNKCRYEKQYIREHKKNIASVHYYVIHVNLLILIEAGDDLVIVGHQPVDTECKL